jgi:hypothetical protein
VSVAGTHVEGSVLTSQQMALQVLQVQVRLVAVRAFVFALGILRRCRGCLARSGRGSAGMRRQNASPSLLADDVHRLGLVVVEDRRVRVQRRV